ncbi:MAG: VWA domain-containing protein, partial [Phycisphaerae bacterium]|nr:VWA domain-containing protein [Phycisphaerae bacterium]
TINVEGVSSMVEAFQCYGPQGVSGCGFESHLESMYLALAGAKDANSQHNYGFLREKAILSVVFITDEADCSYNPAAKEIFTTNKVFWEDPLTDKASLSSTCWNAGVACTGSGTYEECHAENYDLAGQPGASDAEAVLKPVGKYVEFLQGIEDAKQAFDGSQEVLVSLIAGVPIGYERGEAEIPYADAVDADFQSMYGVGPGCVVGDPGDPAAAAVPPVREREFAEAFAVEDQRNLYSICQDDYSAALDAIANKLIKQIKPACMTRCVYDADPDTTIAEPVCELSDVDDETEASTDI